MTDPIASAPVWSMALALLGMANGSFVAALVTRWPEGRSVMRGRSACDACGATLRPHELVPLLSALASRGRCRRCHARIDPLHWRIEALGFAIGLAAGLVAPGWTGLAGAVFGWLLLALGALDAVAFWLPDRLTGLLAAGGLAGGLAGIDPPLADRLIGGAAGFVTLWLVAAGYRRWRGREGMGGGDPKLFGAIGLWLGWAMLPSVLVLAGLAGLGVALFAAATGRAIARDTPLPFGTLLAVAAYPAWLVMVGLAP